MRWCILRGLAPLLRIVFHSREAGFLIQSWLQRLIGPRVGVLVELAKPAGLAGALDREFRMTWIGEEITCAARLQNLEAVASQYLAAVEGTLGNAKRA